MKRTTYVGEFVVVGVRHFSNGEHHWIAPDEKDEGILLECMAFCEHGTIKECSFGKPVFTYLCEAENYAMSLAYGEYLLAQWEERRPTWYILELAQYAGIMEEDYKISYPKESEEWTDAQVDDYERECNCEDIAYLSVWNSETDRENEHYLQDYPVESFEESEVEK